jgi:hypothetical protein
VPELAQRRLHSLCVLLPTPDRRGGFDRRHHACAVPFLRSVPGAGFHPALRRLAASGCHRRRRSEARPPRGALLPPTGTPTRPARGGPPPSTSSCPSSARHRRTSMRVKTGPDCAPQQHKTTASSEHVQVAASSTVSQCVRHREGPDLEEVVCPRMRVDDDNLPLLKWDLLSSRHARRLEADRLADRR